MRKGFLIFALVLITSCSNEAKGFTKNEPDCKYPQIKGNLTTYNGEKIYHVPDGQFYGVTDAEGMFCTEEDAEAAGYRKSKR